VSIIELSIILVILDDAHPEILFDVMLAYPTRGSFDPSTGNAQL